MAAPIREHLSRCAVWVLGIVLACGPARADGGAEQAKPAQAAADDDGQSCRVPAGITLDQIIVAEVPELRSGVLYRWGQDGGERDPKEVALQAAGLRGELQKARDGRKRDAEASLLFQLAYLFEKTNQGDQALEYFRALTTQHPESRFTPLVHALLAETYVRRHEPASALRFYREIERYPQSRVFPYATYMAGWCHYELAYASYVEYSVACGHYEPAEYDAAAKAFISLLEPALAPFEAGKTHLSKEEWAALTKAAKRSLVWTYVHAPGLRPDLAWPLFRRVGGDDAQQMLEALAKRYWDAGMFAESTKVYGQLISQHPADPRTCQWQNLIVRNALSGGSKADQLREMQQLAVIYEGLKRRDSAAQPVAPCEKLFRELSKDLARYGRQEGMLSCHGVHSDFPIAIIELFLTHFPDDPDALELRFGLARVLTKGCREQYERAALEYERIVQADPHGPYAERAAGAAITARLAASGVNLDAKRGRSHRRPVLGPQPIPPLVELVLANCDVYLRVVPTGSSRPWALRTKARIFHAYQHFREAAQFARELLEQDLNDSQLAIILLESLEALGEQGELSTWIDKLRSLPELRKDKALSKYLGPPSKPPRR